MVCTYSRIFAFKSRVCCPTIVSFFFAKNTVQQPRRDVTVYVVVVYSKDGYLHQDHLPQNENGDPIYSELYIPGSSLACAVPFSMSTLRERSKSIILHP
jgi:hypothetical protein